MTKNEKLKQANIDKIALFLSQKYNKVFKDKNFTIDILKQEISKLLVGKNMKTFKFNDNIKSIEKSILKKLTNYGETKYEPIQMEKINNLLSYKDTLLSSQNTNGQNELIPVQNNKKIKAPKSAGERIKNVNANTITQNKNIYINIANNNVKKNNEIPYPTEKMEKLKERENNKWAIQTKKEHEQYIKEQELYKRSVYEKKLKQREILEQQIREKREAQQKTRYEEIGQPSLTSLNIGNNNINKENKMIKRPQSSKPLNNRTKEENEYQKKIKEDLKKYEEEEKLKKKTFKRKI